MTGILPWLMQLAGSRTGLDNGWGSVLHYRRGEYPSIIVNVVLFALAAFVAYGRFVV